MGASCWRKVCLVKLLLCFLVILESQFGVLADSDSEDLHSVIQAVARSKRELIRKILDDPDDCVQRCTTEETSQAAAATTENTNRLIAIGMQDAKMHKHRLLLDSEEELQQQMHDLTINNMGPLFDDLCDIAKRTDECLRKCPQSLFREIAISDHNDAIFYCEPGAHWPSFTEYYMAIDCHNKTLESKACDGQCGRELSVPETTGLQLNNTLITYETDQRRNAEKAKAACVSMDCHTNCYLPLIVERCGQKSFDLYKRISKLPSKSALDILKLMNAIDSKVAECKMYSRR